MKWSCNLIRFEIKKGSGKRRKQAWGRNDTFDSGKSKFHKGDVSGGVNEYIFGCWVGFSPISKVCHECLGRQWGITLRDNPVRHCLLLRNLVPTSFFKEVMIMLLKMHASGTIFDKTCLKAIKIFFFNMWSVIRRQLDSNF